ncbi:RES family NAD+ phosphorylase [Pyramidobacter piscolens]|nr:RES family NAD+ phosphorylase [Pyramidobacter piscolens]
MFCCSNCFADTEIKAIIDGNKTTGDCDFCGSHNIHVYEIGKDSIIAELFDGLLDIYTPVSDLSADFPREKTDLIKNILCNNCRIFNLKPDGAYRLITTICANRYKDQPELFDSPVAIKQCQNLDYLEENSILKNNCWGDFVEGIKRKNRFHGDYINTDKLFIFLRCAVKFHHKGEVMYRSRICPDEKGFMKTEMGAPPDNKAKGGRVNPMGISILYLSDSTETTLYEIRAGVYDFVTVGRFKLQKDIEVINLAGIDHISPFIGIDYGFDFIQYAMNIEHLKMISQEIAKPLRNDNALDYLPTQYISDYIRSRGYDGIEYISTMCKNGANLAVFNPSLFKCTGTSVYDVKSISYSYTKL